MAALWRTLQFSSLLQPCNRTCAVFTQVRCYSRRKHGDLDPGAWDGEKFVTEKKHLETPQFPGQYNGEPQPKGKLYDKKPFRMEVEAGKLYRWCACGLSHIQQQKATNRWNTITRTYPTRKYSGYPIPLTLPRSCDHISNPRTANPSQGCRGTLANWSTRQYMKADHNASDSIENHDQESNNFLDQPFCDNTHRYEEGSSMKKTRPKIKPFMYKATETKTVYWCNCKQTNKPPFCDGTHKDPDIQEANTVFRN